MRINGKKEKVRRWIVVGSGVAIPSTVPAIVFAEATGTANQAVVSAMTTVSQDMIATANSVIPVALTVVGIALVVVFGIRIFRKVVK